MVHNFYCTHETSAENRWLHLLFVLSKTHQFSFGNCFRKNVIVCLYLHILHSIPKFATRLAWTVDTVNSSTSQLMEAQCCYNGIRLNASRFQLFICFSCYNPYRCQVRFKVNAAQIYWMKWKWLRVFNSSYDLMIVFYLLFSSKYTTHVNTCQFDVSVCYLLLRSKFHVFTRRMRH